MADDARTRLSLQILEDQDGENMVLFPVPDDSIITLKDIQDAFPGANGFRYRDAGSTTPNHILCRDGVFIEPLEGWGKPGRIYYVMKLEQNNDRRLGQFESYRTEIEKQRTGVNPQRRPGPRPKMSCEESSGVKLHIGRGEFKDGSFKKLTASSAVGGHVVVGPFPKDSHCAQQIREEAFKKFQTILREFRKKFHSLEQMTLVYPDGSVVENLPDGSAKFSIRGYRDYLDPSRKYERLRLYLVETAQIENDIEIVTDESSDSLPDPFEVENMTLNNVLHQHREHLHDADMHADHITNDTETTSYLCTRNSLVNTPQSSTIDLTNDNTLPLDIKVRFSSSDNPILTGTFEQSSSVKDLERYIRESGMYRHNHFQLLFQGQVMDPSEKLYRFNLQLNKIMDVQLKPLAEPTDRVFAALGRHRLSLRRPQQVHVNTPQQIQTNETNTSQENQLDTTEIMRILEAHSDDVLFPTPDEDPVHFNNINVSRYYVLEDFLEYVQDRNFEKNKKFKIHFVSSFGDHEDVEIAIDEGGPRREFFRILLEALVLTSGLLEGPETRKVFSSKVSALKTKKYFFAGYAVVASILMGGQPICCLAPSVVDTIIGKQTVPTIEEVTDYELRAALMELSEAESTSSMRQILDDKLEVRFGLGVDKPTSHIVLQDKGEIINDICLSYVIHRTTPALVQFMEGLEALGFLTLLRTNPGLRKLLEYSDRYEVNPTRLKESMEFNFSDRGSNNRPLEERLAKRLVDYVDDIFESPRSHEDHEVTLHSLFAFITGLSKFPPLARLKIKVVFDHDAPNNALPSANTCGCVLNIPVYEAIREKDVFNNKFDFAILYAGGMHAL